MDQKKEPKIEPNQSNPHVQSIIIKKVRMKTDPGNHAAKRQKISHTYKVESNEKSKYLLTNQNFDSNDAANNEIQFTIHKTEERMVDEYQDTDFENEKDFFFPESSLTGNKDTTYYAENGEADLNNSENLLDQNIQSTLFNLSAIPSRSIQTPAQAGTSNDSVNTASDSISNEETEYFDSNIESVRIVENPFPSIPNYCHREIHIQNSVVNSEAIYGIICEENSETHWTYNEDDLDLTDQLKMCIKFLNLKVDILSLITESLIKDQFEYDCKQFCFQNHSQGQKCQSISDCLKKQHYETNNWLENLNQLKVWYIITSVFEKPDMPPCLFFSHVIDWLSKKKDIPKIMWIAKTLADKEKSKTPETEHSEVWNYILKALISLGMKRWSAISILLCFCHEKDFPQVTTRIIFSLKLHQDTCPNYWKYFQLLIELKFQLPQIILAKILEISCHRNIPIRGNDKFISNIAIQVCQIKKSDFIQIKDLVQNFLNEYEELLPSALKIKVKAMFPDKKKTIISERHIIKRIKNLTINTTKTNAPQENNNGPSRSVPETNVNNVLISLQKAIESQDNLAIAKILVLNCNAPSSNKIGEKFYYSMQNKENIGAEVVNIISQIDKITRKRADKLLFAKLCIDLMFFLAYNDKWTEAYQVLTLVRYMNYNPVTLKPIVHSLTGVCTAVTCSQVLLNSGHFNSAINVIINNKLLYEDQTKWLVEGKKQDFDLVKNTISTLFFKFLETKMIRLAIKLFNEVIKVQNSIFVPMNIFSTFESLLKQMFINFDRNIDLAMQLYLEVYELNEEFQLDKFTNRLLIIGAMRSQVYHIIHGLVSFAITSHAYPIKQSKKNTITLTTELLEEEMMAYIIIWCGWFYNRIINEPHSSNVNLNISIELKELKNREDTSDQELPDILKSVDSSLAGAILRVNAAIEKIGNIPNISAETFLKSNPVKLSTASSQKLISSACQLFINREANQ